MSGERIELETGRGRFPLPRLVLLALVILGTAWAFTRHFEGVADRFQPSGVIRDETGTLTTGQMTLLRDAAKAMREAYGIDLAIHASKSMAAPPPPSPRTLYVGLDVPGRQAVVLLPPLLHRALPSELAQNLANGYFDPFFAAGTWPDGLNSFVLAILEALRDAK